jgi:hypothetical protein
MTNPLPLTVRAIIAHFPAVVPHLSRQARIAFSIKADISEINASYHDEITQALVDFFEGASITTTRNAMKRAMIQAFGDAFDAGYVEGGGTLPVDDESLAWLEERLNQEALFIDGLFAEAKELRKIEDYDWFAWASQRADGYTRTLREIHNQAKIFASGNIMLEFGGKDGKENCPTCHKLKGKRHKLSWWVARGLVPGPGNMNYECAGYNCEHYLFNPKTGERFTN